MAELLAHLARQLVDDPDAVEVQEVEQEGTTVLQLRVAKEDIGKVIVTREVVTDNVAPTLIPRESETKKKKSA